MEKINLVLGVPYSLEIGTNDPSLKKCEGELCITMTGYRIAIPLKHTEGIEYTVKIPKKLKDLVDKKLKYKLYVYAENSRFLVESGNLSIISEESFTVNKKDQEDEKKEDSINKEKDNAKNTNDDNLEDSKKVEEKKTEELNELIIEDNKFEKAKKKIIQIDESVIKEKVKSKTTKRRSLLDGVIKQPKAFSELEKLKEDNKRRKEKRKIKEAEEQKKQEKNKKIQESLKNIKK